VRGFSRTWTQIERLPRDTVEATLTRTTLLPPAFRRGLQAGRCGGSTPDPTRRSLEDAGTAHPADLSLALSAAVRLELLARHQPSSITKQLVQPKRSRTSRTTVFCPPSHSALYGQSSSRVTVVDHRLKGLGDAGMPVARLLQIATWHLGRGTHRVSTRESNEGPMTDAGHAPRNWNRFWSVSASE
jgi:hypothetical protein